MSGLVEQRGIDLVSPTQRYGKSFDLFFLWAGTTTNIFTVSYGAMLVILFGLSFWQAAAVIVVGNILAYPLLSLTSVTGPVTGTTTITISRSSFGPNGARIAGILSWLMLIGFEAGGLILVYYAVSSLIGNIAGVTPDGGVQIALIIALGAIQMVLPLVGHKLLMVAQKNATIIFAISFVVLAFLILPQANFDNGDGASPAALVSACGLVMVSGGLSWAPSGANFSRYLPANSSQPAVGFWAAMGGFVPYVLLQTLGAAMATVTVGDSLDLSDPLAVPAVLAPAFAIPFLILVAVGLLIQNGTNLYSSGLNLQTAGLKVPRMLIVVTDTIACIIIAIIATSQSTFYDLLSAFIGSMSIWLAPWVAVFIVDWAQRRGSYNLAGLEGKPGSAYWGTNGIRLPGMIALITGMIFAALCANTGYFVGPLAALWNSADPMASPDLSIPVGMLVAGVIYALTNRGSRPAPVRVPGDNSAKVSTTPE